KGPSSGAVVCEPHWQEHPAREHTMSFDRYRDDEVDGGEERGLEPRRVAPGKRTLTQRLLAGLDGDRGEPLADLGGAPDGAAASPASAGVRVVAGPRAAAAAAALGAEAFPAGDRIFFAGGAYQPASPRGRALIRHELAHVEQQRGAGAPGSLAELPVAGPGSPAEQAADRAESGESASAVGGGAPFIARKSIDDRLVRADRYALWHAREIGRGAYLSLVSRRLPFPSPHATWLEGSGAFWKRLIDLTWHGDSADFIADLRRLLIPVDLYQIVDSARAMNGSDDGGPASQAGPLRWAPSVGVAVADALYKRVHDGLARVAPRYLAARARAAEAGHGSESDSNLAGPEPDARRILAAHPVDRLIARALCSGGLVDIDTSAYRAARSAPGAPPEGPAEVADAGDPKAVKWRFLDDPRSPNWIEVTEPPGASRELVADAVLGTPLKAHRLEAAPPFFGLSLEDASALRLRHGLATPMTIMVAASAIAGPATPEAAQALDVDRDPAFGLLRGDRADQAALAQAGQPEEGAVADRGGLLKTLERTRLQIALARDQARPLGLARRLGEVEKEVQGRLVHFASAPDQEVVTWQLHAEKQHDIVFGALMGLEQLRRHLP